MSIEQKKIIRAGDVMEKNIVFIDGMATAGEAAAKMRAEKVNTLLVDKRDENDVWGIVVIQDFIRGVIMPSRAPHEVNVYEIMTKPVITVPADMDIKYVARLLYRAGIRRAPVADKGEIVGMISLDSLILGNELF